MVMCWNCGNKIEGKVYRSWQTTGYSQRAYGGMGLRSGRIYVGASGGQRQSMVSLCDLCDQKLNPSPYTLAMFYQQAKNQWYDPDEHKADQFKISVISIGFGLFFLIVYMVAHYG